MFVFVVRRIFLSCTGLHIRAEVGKICLMYSMFYVVEHIEESCYEQRQGRENKTRKTGWTT